GGSRPRQSDDQRDRVEQVTSEAEGRPARKRDVGDIGVGEVEVVCVVAATAPRTAQRCFACMVPAGAGSRTIQRRVSRGGGGPKPIEQSVRPIDRSVNTLTNERSPVASSFPPEKLV